MSDDAPALEMDAQEREAFIAAVEEGIAEADAGLFVPFETVVAWLESWGEEAELPPPL